MIDRTIKILVVDDDPSLLAVLEAGLQQQPDYRPHAVGDSKQALKTLQDEEWDLLVTDYALGDPDINGVDLLRAARRLPRPPLVIIITAFASLQVTLESINLGAHNFLTKPFQMDELCLATRNAAAAIRMERENRSLREEAQRLARSLAAIEQEYRQWQERLRRLEYEGVAGEADGDGEPVEAFAQIGLDATQAMELRRRRMRDQMAAYLRVGEGIGQRIEEQRLRVEQLVRFDKLDG
jgi:DNA-binding NtrC family response regulator